MNLQTEIQPLGVALPGERPDDLLRRDAAAAYLRRRYCIGSRQHLMNLAWRDDGPRYRKIGAIVVYRRGDLDAWVASRASPLIDPSEPVERCSTYPTGHAGAPLGEPEHAASAA